MKSKSSQRKMFMRIITTPIRALCKARDLYVRGLTQYGDRMNLGNVMAVQGTSQCSGLPRSFSVSSARSTGNRADHMDCGAGPRAMPPRSSSVAMGRIDEDRPYINFGDQDIFNSGKNGINYPRSRSHAVTYSRRLL
ncbi:hypothetical protein MIMGU_mgv1a016061mg [Erythranthe guttata]|uniref:Uncharacterized protein n=1 Tax=Erythranthe guttata TaxID=4155 RepID=A0A022QUM6_ERYGU|nr:hypothetical protein MIMGU_mgv1a016061mg [Erythranthe guttata]